MMKLTNCEATIEDIDGEPTRYYSWWADGSLLGNMQSLDLNSQSVFPNDTITCIVSVIDSYGDSDEASAEIMIGNRSPSAPSVSIDWSTGGYFITETDDLICTGEGSVDPDSKILRIRMIGSRILEEKQSEISYLLLKLWQRRPGPVR